MTSDVDEEKSDDCDQGSLSIEFDEVVGDVSAVLSKIERVFRAELCLSPFSSKIAVQYLRSRLSDQNLSADFSRVTGYVLDMINKHSGNVKSNVTPCAGQIGCPNVIRGLRAIPIWDTRELPWVRELEAAGPAICEELMALRGHKSFQPYRAPILNVPPTSSNYLKPENSTDGFDSLGTLATSKGDWNVCYLHLHGENFTDCLERCPTTAAAIGAIPRHYHHAFFSALAPSTHVSKHNGSTNKKLRCHLPLRVPNRASRSTAPCWLRVGDVTVPVQEGVAIVFDDSFEHEAANEHNTEPRVVLVVDFWHPDFSDEEVKFLEYVGKRQMSSLRNMTDSTSALVESASDGAVESDHSEPESFLDVIRRTKKAAHLVTESDVWGQQTVQEQEHVFPDNQCNSQSLHH